MAVSVIIGELEVVVDSQQRKHENQQEAVFNFAAVSAKLWVVGRVGLHAVSEHKLIYVLVWRFLVGVEAYLQQFFHPWSY